MNDAEKLRAIADYFDKRSYIGFEFTSGGESITSTDLRRIADDIERKAVSDKEIEDHFTTRLQGPTKRELDKIEGAKWMREKLTRK